MDLDILRELKLTESEIKIYLDLVKYGCSKSTEISKRTGISRTHVYDSTTKLIEKGFATYILKNNTRYFNFQEIEKLNFHIDQKQKELDLKKEKVKELIKELNNFKKVQEKKPDVEVLEGKEGLKTILNDILKVKKTLYVWGAIDKINNLFPKVTLERYLKEREKNKIKVYALYSEDRKPLITRYTNFKKMKKEYSSIVNFNSYGDRLIIFFWSEVPITIRIKNKEIADSFTEHFKKLWKII